MSHGTHDSLASRRLALAILGGWGVAWSLAAVTLAQAVSGTSSRCETTLGAVALGGLPALVATAALVCLSTTRRRSVGDTRLSAASPPAGSQGAVWTAMNLLPGAIIACGSTPGSVWSTLAGYGVVALPCAWATRRPGVRDQAVAEDGGAATPALASRPKRDAATVRSDVADPRLAVAWNADEPTEDDVEMHDLVDTDDDGAFDESLVQRFTRGRDASGEWLQGLCRVDFVAGQRQASLHLPFAPPFASVPRVSATPTDGDDLRLTVAANFRYGVRIDVRRPDAADARSVWVAIEAQAEAPRAKSA